MASQLTPPPQSRLDSDTTGNFANFEAGVPDFYKAKVPVPQLSYPSELKSGVRGFPFIHLNVVDAVASAPRTQYAIGLYMPSSIRVAYNANWETLDLGLFGFETANTFQNGVGGGANRLTGIAGEAAFKAAQNILDKTMGVLGTNVGAGAQIGAGIQVNPHTAIMFKGMALREFQMDFTFFPKNHAESEELRDIIFQLKYAMHPDISQATLAGNGAMSRFFLFPNNFIIGFYRPDMKFLFRTSPCALINCTVEYNGSGVPAFFSTDNRPACIQMSLHFKENEMLTRDRIRQGW